MSSDQYKRILENLNQVLLVFNADLCLEFINPAGEMLFAVSANRLIGQSADTLFPEGSHLLESLKKGQTSGHPFTEHEVTCTLPGQRDIIVDYTITPLAERAGQSGLLVELQQMDRQIRFSREEHQMAQQQTFRTLVRGLAHEIKNPLGGLRGAAQLLERELPDEELKEFTNIIIGEAARRLECNPVTVKNLVKRGVLSCFRDHRGWRYLDSEEIEQLRILRSSPPMLEKVSIEIDREEMK